MKLMTRPTALAAAIASAAMCSMAPAQAGSTFANVTVSANVNQTCNMVKNTDVAFASPVDVLATASLTAVGQVTLTCNKGATPTVTTDSTGLMSNGTDTLSYQLRVPSITGGGPDFTTCPAFGSGTSWLNGGGSLSANAAYASSGGPAKISICGEMSTPQLGASAGLYTQTVKVTATYP
jgi:spore coat protein U-like protein